MNRVRDDSLKQVFARHRGRLLLTVLLLWTTMLAGTALLGLSGGFLTAAALAGAAGLAEVRVCAPDGLAATSGTRLAA